MLTKVRYLRILSCRYSYQNHFRITCLALTFFFNETQTGLWLLKEIEIFQLQYEYSILLACIGIQIPCLHHYSISMSSE